jgi:sporulation protein YlmC with PRC-barrel domain
MKTLRLIGAIVAILGAAIIPTSAQTQSTNVQVSKLVGTKVKSSQGEEIGTIKDVVIDRSTGCMAYTVLSTGEGGARPAGGGKMVAVPWAVYSPESDISALTVTVDRERIYSAPVFEYARIDEYSRPDYITNVYSYYGVSQGPGVGVSGTTTTTGVSGSSTTTGTAGATGRTGATGSPPQASPPAAGTRSPAERESPAGKASPSPRATSARGRATAPPREREGAESSPAREERGTRGRPGETESPSSGTREERGTRPQPGENRSPSGGTELQREPSSRATRESPPEAATSSGERTREGTETRPRRKPERPETAPSPEGPQERD